MTITIPTELVSEANTREHWKKKWRRSKKQREDVAKALLAEGKPPPLPVTVTITRVYSGRQQPYDDDNMKRAAKAIRDEVANWLLPELNRGNKKARWADDSDPRITWKYDQRRGATRCVEVEVIGE